MLRVTCYGYYTTRKFTRNTRLTGLLCFRNFSRIHPAPLIAFPHFILISRFPLWMKRMKIAVVKIARMCRRDLTSPKIDTLELFRLSPVHLSTLFFYFTFLRRPFYSISIRVSLAYARVFACVLLERPANHRCDPFEFSSLKLLYTFSCSKVLDSADLSRFLGCLRSLAMLRHFYIILISDAVISRF